MSHPIGEEILSSEVDVIAGAQLSGGDLAAVLGEVDGLYGAGTSQHVRNGARLRVIGVTSSGVEGIDVDAATEAGIVVVNAAGAQSGAVAEHAIAMMLSLSKLIGICDRRMHSNERYIDRTFFRDPSGPGMPREVNGKTVGIVGFGFVGRAIATKCQAGFGMRVLAYDPFVGPCEATNVGAQLVDDLETLLHAADFVVVTAPLTDATHHLISTRQLSQMKDDAYLINVARGAVIDHDALVGTLRAGRIAGAGLDVFDPEPLPDGHPLFTMENVVLTPHIAGWVEEALPRLAATTAQAMLDVLRDVPPTRMVNPDVWPTRRKGPRWRCD